MKINWDEVKIYIKPGATEMRKQINGLSVIVEEEFPDTPFSGHLFLFCNRSRRHLKALYWDRNGFCLWLKRLEKDRFPWPISGDGCRELSGHELEMLLSGIDFFHAHRTLHFSAVS